MRRRYPVVIGVVLFVVFVAWIVWPQESGRPDDIHGRVATVEEAAELTRVVERAEAATSRVRRTGDVSELMTLLIDDSTYPLRGDLAERWKRDQLGELLGPDTLEPSEPVGLLSYTVAASLRTHRDGPPYWDGPGKPIVVYDIQIDDDHAGAKSKLREGGGTITHYIFTHDGQRWRISAMWATCLPGGCA